LAPFFSSQHLVLRFLVGKVYIKGCNLTSLFSRARQFTIELLFAMLSASCSAYSTHVLITLQIF